MPYLAILKNSSKKFLDPDPEADADDLQNLISSSLSAETLYVFNDSISSTLRDSAFLHNLAHISTQTDRIFVKILPQV